MIRYAYSSSRIGRLTLVENDHGLLAIRFGEQPPEGSEGRERRLVERLDVDVQRQLGAYFAGELTEFDLPTAAPGSDFQRAVWRAVSAIPFGETRSYLAIAEKVGGAAAVRAVGAATGRNPLPIVVPCHRVVGSDGSLTGYAGGLARKRTLLELERPEHYGLGPLFAERR